MSKKILTVTVFCFSCLTGLGQSMPLGWSVQTELLSSTPEHYTLNVKDGPQTASGDIRENLRARLGLGYTFQVTSSLNIGISAHYAYNNESLTGLSQELSHWGDNHHSFKGGVNLMYHTKLWQKPLVAFANIGADASQWGVERVSGIAVAMLMLKATRETQFGIGGMLMVNTTSRLPFILVATYRHVFSPKWTLNLNYPFFAMQYTPSRQHTIGAGFTFDTYHYWLRPDHVAMPKTVFYRRSLFKLGANYDCRLTSSLTLTAQTGWEYTMNGGIYTASGHKQLYELNHPNGLYGHIGIRYRPKK